MIRKAADGAKLARHPASTIRTCLIFLIAVKIVNSKENRGAGKHSPKDAAGT